MRGGGGSPMSPPPSRPRTRNQLDQYYRNLYNERKRKEADHVDKDVRRSLEGHVFVIDEEDSKHGGSSVGRRGKRTMNVTPEQGSEGTEKATDNSEASTGRVLRGKNKLDVRPKSESDGEIEFLGEILASNGSSLKMGPELGSRSDLKVGCDSGKGVIREDEDDDGGNETPQQGSEEIEMVMDNNKAPASRDLRGKRKFDVSPKSDSDDDIEFLGEQLASHGSSLENGLESGSGSGSKASCDLGKGVKEEDEGNSEQSGCSARPEKKPLDDSVYSVDSDNIVDLCLSEDESSGEHDDHDHDGENDDDDDELSSDEDYRVEEMTNSESSEEEEKTSDATVRPRGKSRIVKEESNTEREKGDDDDDGSSFCKRGSNQQTQEEEIKVELDEIDDDSGCYKTSADWGKSDDEDVKFSSIRKSPRLNPKGDGEMDGLTRNYEPCSKYGYKGRKDGDSIGSRKAREADNNLNESGLKKRRVFSVVDIPVDSGKINDEDEVILARLLKLHTSSKPNEKEPGLGTFRCQVEKGDRQFSCKKKSRAARNEELSKNLIEIVKSNMMFYALKRQLYSQQFEEEQYSLPLKFRFEDEVEPPPPEKSEWEKHIDSLFHDLELGLYGSEMDGSDSSGMENEEDSSTETDKSPAACCGHDPILDEQRGIVCNYCDAVILDIKYVLPQFYTRPSTRQDRKLFYEPPSFIPDDQTKFQDSYFEAPNLNFSPQSKGTVWDLVNGVEQEMYPHQREGFEFMWKNICGHTILEKLKDPLPEGGKGCIISHAPGTGKTRLTIVFLQSFLRFYPACRPVIIAPRGMLLTWESEFKKWNVNIPFINMNQNDLSVYENSVTVLIISNFEGGGVNMNSSRLLKLHVWMERPSILGISYQLFEKLKNGKGEIHQVIRNLLLKCPSLLVLDEGHTPRNEKSRLWKALSEVSTQRRIILSGTPFQNNFVELYNTLALVNPKMANQMGCVNSTQGHGQKHRMARKKWMDMTSSIGKKTDDGLEKLKNMLEPFVHVHKGTILQEKLPGLRETLIFLQPTELQKELLETCSKLSDVLLRRIRMVSLVSVHPSLMEKVTEHLSSDLKTKLEQIKLNVEEGVKMRFVMKLIKLANAVGERVLIFSQYLDPLHFIKKQITTHFSWKEGRELLYMDGQLDQRKRQVSISSFNDEKSEAKVLLASEFACCEGISLVGASRVVLLDTVWNPSTEKQAISRAYRLGQKRFVYVYRLLTSGTEVRQCALQIRKTRISELLFSPVDEGSDKSKPVLEDKVLEAMLGAEGFGDIFEMVKHQPKESDIMEISGLVEH